MIGKLTPSRGNFAQAIELEASRLHGTYRPRGRKQRAQSSKYRIQAASETVTNDRVPEGLSSLAKLSAS